MEMMNDCYKKNYRDYDWLIFFEIDEYIFLYKNKNIKRFFQNPKFKKCERIQLNWIFHIDNNLLYYAPRPLKERFSQREKKSERCFKRGLEWNKVYIKRTYSKFNNRLCSYT